MHIRKLSYQGQITGVGLEVDRVPALFLEARGLGKLTRLNSPNWRKYSRTSSVAVSWLTPPTKIFLVLLSRLLKQKSLSDDFQLLVAPVLWSCRLWVYGLSVQKVGRCRQHLFLIVISWQLMFKLDSFMFQTLATEEAERKVMKPNPRLRCNQTFVSSRFREVKLLCHQDSEKFKFFCHQDLEKSNFRVIKILKGQCLQKSFGVMKV